MAYNGTNPVTVGSSTKKDHYDRVFDNTVALRAGEIAIASQANLDFAHPTGASTWGRVAVGIKFTTNRVNNGATAYEFAAPHWLRAVDDVQAATAADTSETILYTYTIPASLLDANGRTLRLTAFGTFANNANTKTVRVRLGGIAGTVIVSAAFSTAGAGIKWRATVFVARIAANSQRVAGAIEIMNVSSNDPDRAGLTTAAQIESGTIDLVVTGQNGTASASDIVYECAWVEQLGVAA